MTPTAAISHGFFIGFGCLKRSEKELLVLEKILPKNGRGS
jgi:hypothetical protein